MLVEVQEGGEGCNVGILEVVLQDVASVIASSRGDGSGGRGRG